jgi:predicted Zn-dependent protease
MARECPQNKFNDAIKLLEVDPEQGVERWRELARHYPSDIDVRLNYGIALLQTDDPFSAVQQLELATQRNADVNSGLMRRLECPNMALRLRVAFVTVVVLTWWQI